MNAFRQVAERRRWSWLWKEGQFLVPASIATGTVTVTRNTATVTGDATAAAAWNQSIVGRQFRCGNSNPIYSILTVTTTTNPNDTLTLDQNWAGTTLSAQGYKIYQCYFTVPTDFHSFITVVDMKNMFRLDHNVGQDYINLVDPARTATGMPFGLSMRKYDTSSPPLPQYEMWPAQMALFAYPFLYEIRATDISDSGAALPRFIRGDMLLEMALANAARWPGPAVDKPNPYYDLRLAQMHDARAEQMIAEAERQDEEVTMQALTYQQWQQWPMSDPSMFGDAYWQSHAPVLM